MMLRFAGVVCALVLIAGCSEQTKKTKGKYTPKYDFDDESYREIVFNDNAQSNTKLSAPLTSLELFNDKGERVALKSMIGKKTLVVVMTRGYPGEICVFCSTQVSRLIANFDKFKKLDADVVVIFPIQSTDHSEGLKAFVDSTIKKIDTPPEKLPFPILIDPEQKAVERLAIKAELAKPATYILDKGGNIRFAYVGNEITDRPSLKAMLSQVEAIQKSDAEVQSQREPLTAPRLVSR